jgi:hypothetical protein
MDDLISIDYSNFFYPDTFYYYGRERSSPFSKLAKNILKEILSYLLYDDNYNLYCLNRDILNFI